MSDNEYMAVKRKFQRLIGTDKFKATLGDLNGVLQPDPINRPGYYNVRYATAAGLSLPPVLRMGPNFVGQTSVGLAVICKYDENDDLVIWGNDVKAQIARGFNPTYNNPADPSTTKTIPTSDILPLKSHATSPVSKKVVVRSLLSYNGTIASLFGGAQVDLTSYIPSTGNQCLAGIFLKSDNTLEVAVSSTQSIAEPFDLTDVQECLAGASVGSAPVWIWWLHNNQPTITDADNWIDQRQYLNVPALTTETIYQAKALTTDATVTTLYAFTIPASTTYAISAKVVARRTGGASGTAEDGAYYERVAAIKNAAGTATIIGSVATPITIEDQAGWDCTIDVTGATARVRVTGAASNNVSWILTAKVYQVSS